MPKINEKSFEDLLEDKRRLARLYVPEWRPASEEDLGVALLKIFTHMQEEILNRLNRVPENNFAAFLDMLGIKLMPARPARVPVTFYLAEGLRENVFVPAATQVATAETEVHEALTYETVKSFTATGASIEGIFSVDPKRDVIYNHHLDLVEKREFRFFEGENLQEHVLYMGHGDLFKVEEATRITLKFKFADSISSADLRSWKWVYWTEEGKTEFDIDKDSIIGDGDEYLVRLKLKPETKIKEQEIWDKKCLWIACKMSSAARSQLPIIEDIRICEIARDENKPLRPDLGFCNFIPLDLFSDFYPFGRQPRLFDTFYIASKEAFSKKGAEITIKFDGTGDHDENEPILSWEYWDGSSWVSLRLKDIADGPCTALDPKTFNGCVKFDCPENLQETEVGGEVNCWIRVRLISGNYGREEFIEKKTLKKDTSGKETLKKVTWIVSPNFNPPKIVVNDTSGVEIRYQLGKEGREEGLQYCLTYNNLEYRDVTEENRKCTGFEPFVPLPERYPTLYLGFKSPFGKGNVNIFFSMRETSRTLDFGSELGWYYWSKAPSLADNVDGVAGENGTSELGLASSEGIKIGTELLFEEKFDGVAAKEIASVVSTKGNIVYLDRKLNHKYTRTGRILKRDRLETVDNTENLTKSETLEFIGPTDHLSNTKFGRDSYWLMGISTRNSKLPMTRGIYPNTVWAEQVETVEDEILGSSDGGKNSRYRFIRRPVISQEIWVREGTAIPRDDRDLLSSEGIEVQEVKNDADKVVDSWVRWNAVGDLFDSGPRSRHYVLDGATGEAIFGDGIDGMIPPIGTDNIKASYKSGGGVKGNVIIGEVNVLKTPIAGANRVVNHVSAEGGSDTETLESVLQRGPHLIKHMERAVTIEDFERLAKDSSSEIAITRIFVDGPRLKIVIIPKGDEEKPMPTPGLMRTVKSYLLERSLNSIFSNDIEVSGPCYKEVRVTVQVVPVSIGAAGPLEREVTKRLKEYLHPLKGGPDREGWRFVRDVHISDIYSLLEGIEGVDHVENLELNDEQEDVKIIESEMVCSGDHRITMKLGEGS